MLRPCPCPVLPLALCLALLPALPGFAAAPGPRAAPSAAPDTERVVEVRALGLRRVDMEAALAGTQLQRGRVFDPAMATQDLRRVWRSGFFRDVRLERQTEAAGLVLIYTLVEKPAIRTIRYAGLDALSEDDVKGVVDVKPFTILNIDALKRNGDKIKDLYVGKGYYLAEVGYHLEPVGTQGQEVDVVFDVVENARVSVKQITFLGNTHLSDAQLKAAMQTREGNELSWLTQSGTYKEEFFQTDIYRLQALYYDHGYVTVKVGEPTVTISPDRTAIYIAIPVEEGEQYRIGSIGFSGDLDLPHPEAPERSIDAAKLRQSIHFDSGETFNRTKLFEDMQLLTDLYRDLGYADANVTPNSRVNGDDRVVDLDMEVERGELIHIERIDIIGNVRTRDKVIRRELRIAEGDIFSQGAINLSRARVMQLGYFESVNITNARGGRPGTMTLSVEIKEKSTGTFQIGAGFSSYESLMLTAQISQNNFLGHGTTLSLNAQVSFGNFARQLVTLSVYEPYLLDSFWSLAFNAYINQRYYQDFQRNARGLSPSLGYPLTHELRVSLGYTLEDVAIQTDDVNNSAVLHNLTRAGRVSSLNLTASYDSRDNRLFPTRGFFHELRGEASSPAIGAQRAMEFKRLETDLRFYAPLPLSVVFKGQLQLGYVFGASMGVPVSERYFPGGIYSVRGFQPRGLGPSVAVPQASNDPTSASRPFIIGGTKQAIVNIELEIPIVQAAGIRAVLFADAGNAFNDDENFFYVGTPSAERAPGYMIGSNKRIDPLLGLFYSVGFGLRWFSPMGPLRFEWGVPITKTRPDAKAVIFEFTIGNSF